MKRVVAFLLFALLSVSLCSCTNNTTEVSALKADIIAIMEDLDALKEENKELRAEIASMQKLIEAQDSQILSFLQISDSAVINDISSDFDSFDYPQSKQLSDESLNISLSENTSLPNYEIEQPIASPANEEISPSSENNNESIADTAESDNSNVIYITKSGSRYHFSSSCGSGTYYESTMEEALAKGLTPCKKCAGG
ncbi:MAG: hypothetical protein E7430_00090 [Ruminococcaceae bacterium]|nr:hypothetical protein [Oscillospiraceae bacterium]